ILYKSEPSMEMLEQLARLKKLSFIALQRKNKSGTIVMVIDDTGLRYWGIRVSVEKAMRELRHGQEFEYMRVFDNSYRLLGYTGNMANNTIDNERENISEIINNESSRISHHTVVAGKRIVGMFMPLNLNGKRVGVIHIGMGWGGTDQILEENRRNIFVFVFFVALLTMIALWILYRSHKLHISNILEMERQIEKAERLSSLGKLAAGVAHEIRNPLNAISMAAQRMKRDFTPADPTKVEEFSSLATVIRDEIRRLDGIIEEFLSLSKTRRLDIQPYPLTEMIQKIVSLMDAQAQEKGISFQTDFDENLLVPIDADKFQQALLNIIKNAIESITETGIISISANKINDETAKVVITDNGCGMSQNEIEHIFNPEYTTKEKGLGLGLTLSYEIIRGHGGKINVSSKENRGTAFEIVLPLEKIG
ncbi:MAG: ATP-binding protein, partial [Deltaproteobacteria bacterium]